MGKRVRESARVVLEGKRLGERYKAGWGYYFLLFLFLFLFLLLSTPPTHPSRVGKPTRGQPTLDSTLPPPGPGVGWAGDVQVAVPTTELRRRTGPRVAIVA